MKTNWLEPHNVSWIVLALLVVVSWIFFASIKPYFIEVASIGVLFVVFYIVDDIIFRPVGNSTKDIFSGNLFVKRWKAFPIFLIEIYVIYFASNYLQEAFGEYLQPDKIQWWYMLVWLAFMYAFYYLKASRDN
jgi:hypothetical protein